MICCFWWSSQGHVQPLVVKQVNHDHLARTVIIYRNNRDTVHIWRQLSLNFNQNPVSQCRECTHAALQTPAHISLVTVFTFQLFH